MEMIKVIVYPRTGLLLGLTLEIETNPQLSPSP